MRLLFVIKSLSLRGGGAERVLSAVASELAARGHDVAIASFDSGEAADFYRVDARVRRHRLPIGNVLESARAIDVPRRAGALRQLLRTENPDVAVGFTHTAFIPLALGAAGTGIKVVASEHISFDHYRTVPLQRALMLFAINFAARITAVSDKVKEGFPKRLRQKMDVIPNPVTHQPKLLSGVRSQRSDNIIVSVGRLEEQKDHRTLIAAFDQLAPQFPDWKLRIVGDGTLRDALAAQRNASAAKDRIELPGVIADIGAEYEKAAIFAMPSLYESFGLATAEALSTGIPAIGFEDCPGTNEIIVDEVNGLLVEGADRAAALAAGLEQLMRSPQLRAKLGQAGPASVSKYSLGEVIDRWESVLGAVAGGERLRHAATGMR